MLRAAVSRALLVRRIAIAAVVTAMTPIAFALATEPLWPTLLGSVLALGFWWSALSTPVEVAVHEDGHLHFRSFRGTLSLPVSELRSIDARLLNRGFVTFQHSAGSIHVEADMAGLDAIVDEVRTRAPTVEVRMPLAGIA